MTLQDLTRNYRLESIKLLLVVTSLVLVTPFVCIANEPQAVGSEQPLYDVKHAQMEIIVGEADANKRAVNLVVSYPSGNSQYPLIVFSHGHALDNQSYKNLTNYWVARGYFVVAPLHLDSGGDLKAVSLISKKFGNDWIAASRLIDLAAVINQIDTIVVSLPEFKGSVLIDQVIAAGHSYGALSSQQLAGAVLEQNGDSIYPIPQSLVDSRVVAVVAISPPGLMKGHLSTATWRGFNAPQLVVTGPNDFFPHIWPSYEDHFVSYSTADEGHNYLLVLDQMDHYLGNLIGRLERSGPPQTLALINLQEISTLFMQNYLSYSSAGAVNFTSVQPMSNVSTALNREGVLKFEHR